MESISNSEPSPEVVDDDDDDDEFIEASPDRNDRQKERDRAADDSNKKTPEKPPIKAAEIPEQHDKEIPVHKLDKDEKKLIADQYIQACQPEIGQDLLAVTPETPEEAELLATAALLENISDKLANGEVPTDQSLDESVAKTIRQLGIEIPATSPENTSEDPANTSSHNLPLAKAINPNTPEPKEEITPPPNSVNPHPSVMPSAGGNRLQPPVTNNSGNNQPPILPPSRRPPPSYSQVGGGLPFTPNFYGPMPNVMPATPASNPNLNQAPVTVERRSAALPYLVVGYLLGRRKGRIKTEKKLAPVQKKLEKEISNLQVSITAREENIRALVRQQVMAQPATAEVIVKRLADRREQKVRPASVARIAMKTAKAAPAKLQVEHSTEPEKYHELKTKLTNEAMPGIVSEAAAHTLPAPASETAPLPLRPSEKIGKFAVEYQPPPLSDKRRVTPRSVELPTFPKIYESANTPPRPKSPDTMAIAELLKVAARIPAGHSTVKKLFESNQLDEAGLRQVTKAFLRGDRYDETVKERIRSRDTISFERNFEQVSRPPMPINQQSGTASHGVSSASTYSSGQPTISHNAYTPNLNPIKLKKKPTHIKKTRFTSTAPLVLGSIITVLLLLLLLR